MSDETLGASAPTRTYQAAASTTTCTKNVNAPCENEATEILYTRSMWTLDELRQYAERVSQASGMATVIVAHGGSHREFVVPCDSLGRHGDAAIDALVEAIRQRLEALSAEDSR
jgi:acetyl esterase/lipase